MSTSRKRFVIAAVAIGIACASMPRSAKAADTIKRHKSQGTIEARLELLERQNRLLEQQNRTIQNQLSAETAEIESLKVQMQKTAQPVTMLQKDVPELSQRVSSVERKQSESSTEVGFRTGWSESPYDMPGGFFYGAYLNHRLLDRDDGIPGGFVSGELMAGAVFGNHATTSANLTSTLGVTGPSSSWLDTVEIQPTVQYHLEPAALGYEQLSWIKPYALAGPAIYISWMSTPVVVKGNEPGNGFRHGDADVQGGGVFGLGTQLSFSALKMPVVQGILNRTSAGAEWRYNQMGNGEGFNQYTGSLSFGW